MQTKIYPIYINFTCPLNHIEIEYFNWSIKKNPRFKNSLERKRIHFR